MRVREAAWAALVPWSGVQDKPVWLQNPAGVPISGVIGLQTILDELEGGGGGGTVSWNNITGKPTFGSAAYSSASDFATAAQGTLASTALQPGDNVSELVNDAEYLSGLESATFQRGSEPLVMGQTLYSVIFGVPMAGTPDVETQLHLTDGSGEFFIIGIRDDLTDGTGFTFQLNSAPLASVGHVAWTARVYP